MCRRGVRFFWHDGLTAVETPKVLARGIVEGRDEILDVGIKHLQRTLTR